MGERKVLNKYYPPDFDPSKLPRIRRPKNQQIKVRMMLPMSIRCNTCGNYIYKGTKFNSRKEDVVGEEVDKEKQKRESEEMGDAMRALENRTQDSKREMDVMAALDEMKSMKSRHATVSVDAMLEALKQTSAQKEKRIEEEDEAVIKSIVFHNSKDYIKRIHDEDLDDEEDMIEPLSGNGETSLKRKKLTHGLPNNSTDWLTNSSISDRGNRNGSEAAKFPFKSSTVRVAVVKKPVAAEGKKSAEAEDKKKQSGEEVQNSTKPDKSKTNATTNVLQSLCQYDSDDSDE